MDGAALGVSDAVTDGALVASTTGFITSLKVGAALGVSDAVTDGALVASTTGFTTSLEDGAADGFSDGVPQIPGPRCPEKTSSGGPSMHPTSDDRVHSTPFS
eukprot:scaffold703_cov245-Pinguiococcus_pyrenoidosus.AAC.2